MSRGAAASLAAAVTLGAALLLLPLTRSAARLERAQRCRVHLQQLGSALLVYRAETRRWPDARGGAMLRQLVDRGVLTDERLLRCPTGGRYLGWQAPPPRRPGRFDWNARSAHLAAGDAVGNHPQRRLLLFADGRVTEVAGQGVPPGAEGALVD